MVLSSIRSCERRKESWDKVGGVESEREASERGSNVSAGPRRVRSLVSGRQACLQWVVVRLDEKRKSVGAGEVAREPGAGS